jgi:hypothetical protein
MQATCTCCPALPPPSHGMPSWSSCMLMPTPACTAVLHSAKTTLPVCPHPLLQPQLQPACDTAHNNGSCHCCQCTWPHPAWLQQLNATPTTLPQSTVPALGRCSWCGCASHQQQTFHWPPFDYCSPYAGCGLPSDAREMLLASCWPAMTPRCWPAMASHGASLLASCGQPRRLAAAATAMELVEASSSAARAAPMERLKADGSGAWPRQLLDLWLQRWQRRP